MKFTNSVSSVTRRIVNSLHRLNFIILGVFGGIICLITPMTVVSRIIFVVFIAAYFFIIIKKLERRVKRLYLPFINAQITIEVCILVFSILMLAANLILATSFEDTSISIINMIIPILFLDILCRNEKIKKKKKKKKEVKTVFPLMGTQHNT